MDRLFDSSAMRILSNALAASRLAHEVSAHNLANVETPGFKRSEVLFTDRLAAALAAQEQAKDQLKGVRTHARHLPMGETPAPEEIQARSVVRAETSLRPDGNNVDLDAEMVRLQQNVMLYSTLTQLVRAKFSQLRSAITEGRR